jgi:hypothetical protein
MYIGLRVKYYPLFFPDFNESWKFLDQFSKNISISNFTKIRPAGGGCCMWRDTQRHVANSRFSQFYESAQNITPQKTLISLFPSHLLTFLCATREWTQLNVKNYNRTPLIRINWNCEPSGYEENQDNWIFLWKQATMAVWISAVTTYSMYLRLNLSTTPDMKF